MAQVILSTIGGAVGGPLGRLAGGLAGARLDRMAVGALQPERQIGPRIEGLRLQGAGEGAPIAAAFGRTRVVGQVIWAARFLEHRREGRAGKGGPRTVDYGYSLSFAVGLCEGPIDGVGRVWADGEALDLSGVTMRLHRGGAEQQPDPLIEAVEGAAPAYRDLAYVVFEDLPLDSFGDRVPQLAFEVFRRPRSSEARMEDRLEGVCLIPGAGEFVYATQPVLRREGLTRVSTENVNNREGRADVLVSLDQLLAQAPNLKRVTLLIAWFGDDLRCGHCTVRPGVESLDKATLGQTWAVAGLERDQARQLSSAGGGPAYGGTPSDASVRQMIAALKARGLEVTLAPFLMMDIPEENDLPDPRGGGVQPAYPWRGRVTCDPAPGQSGSADGTAAATTQVAAFFGTATAADFVLEGEDIVYSGPDAWGWRRMVLHYACLAAASEADGLLIGSEFRGLTAIRDDEGYPAVEALRALAQDCRTIIGPGPMLTYAADWTEWSGVQHADDPGGFVFNLDPLWSDPAISCIGVDWYPPVSDWRDGDEHLDAAWGSAADSAYLHWNVQGGEAYDWWYADDTARDAQFRSPITDGAFAEPWMFRRKDLAGWWSHPHHDRNGGVRAEEATDWLAGSKPIRLIEFGCGAVDRGGNAPNLFLDSKSAESALPPFSSGRRDDHVQRRVLEATLDAFEVLEANPAAAAYGGRMIEAMDAWCWDARPFPDFPARENVWADAANWRTGHWLNGRLNGEAGDLVLALAARAGLEPENLDVSGIDGAVEGLIIERPMTLGETLEPLLMGLGLVLADRGGRIGFARAGEASALTLDEEQLALDDEGGAIRRSRVLDPAPQEARVRFIDGEAGYAVGAVTVRADVERDGSAVLADLPLTASEAIASGVAKALLAQAEAGETLVARLGPEALLRLEPGDIVQVMDDSAPWRVARIEADEQPRAELEPLPASLEGRGGEAWRPDRAITVIGPPWFELLDIPLAEGLRVAVAAEPWTPFDVHSGNAAESLAPRGRITQPATVGRLVAPLAPGRANRWDYVSVLTARIEGTAPQSTSAAAVLGGANQAAVRIGSEDWEVLQYRRAELVGPDTWKLTGLLRGQGGNRRRCVAGGGIGRGCGAGAVRPARRRRRGL